MAKFYYNGVLLPEVPVVDGYPYCAIRYDQQNSRIDAIYSQTNFYYTGSTISNAAASNYKRYVAPIANPEQWSTSSDTNYGSWTIASNRKLLWANHDIPNGSSTSTTIYFYTSNPASESEAKPKELEYSVYHNFYPYSGGIEYSAGSNYVNYVVPVVKYSTYTVTMVEVGTRLRSVFTTVNPATITASISGCTDIVMNPSFSTGYTFTYFAQDDGWMVVYVSNAGERPKISIVTNGAGGDGAPLYDRKYMIRSGSTLYTVTGGALEAIPETAVSASAFQTYGVDEIPDGSLLVGLTDPEVLFWQDSKDDLPDISLTVTGTPPLPQIITSDPVDLAHESISAIDHVTANASEDVRFSVSFNGGATWLAHDGSNWFQITETEPGMLASTMNAITTAQWAQIATLTSCQVRAWLPTVTSYVDSVVFHYINP